MKNLKYLVVSFVTAMAFAGFVPSAWAAPAGLSGRIVINYEKTGGAWYVSPVDGLRTYLGRPDQAIGRLIDAGVRVSVNDIAKVPEIVGGAGDAAYTESVLGLVLVPNDAVGAAWYIDPATKTRRRLATAAEAWEVMRTGKPVKAKTLAAIKKRPLAPVTESVACKEVTAGDKLKLKDGRCVRLINVSVPANPELQTAAMDRLKNFCGAAVTIERDVAGTDADGCLPRHVFAGEVYLNYDLVRRGLAFYDIATPNFKYAEQLVVGGLDAAKQKNGFWKK